MFKDFRVTTGAMKLLKEDMGKLLNTGLCNEFMNLTPKAQTTKAKINKWNLKLNVLHAAKKKINKTK